MLRAPVPPEGTIVLVMLPADPLGFSENGVRSVGVPLNAMPLGSAKLGWFRMSKNSARNCTMPASPRNPTLVSFTSEKSQFLKGGPLRMLRTELPSCPMVQGQFGPPCSAAGLLKFGEMENMAGLNHWLTLPVMTVLGS